MACWTCPCLFPRGSTDSYHDILPDDNETRNNTGHHESHNGSTNQGHVKENEFGNLHGPPKQQQMSFFSLPLEIRQEIYSYLLSCHTNRERTPNLYWEIPGVNCECGRWDCGVWDCGRGLHSLIRGNYELCKLVPAWAVKYHFSLGILRVCKQINREAKEFLYRRNQWVQIRFCTDALLHTLHRLGIRPASRHDPNFWNPEIDLSTVLEFHICTFSGPAPCRQDRASRRNLFIMGLDDLADLVPAITNSIQSGFYRLYMRFVPENTWPLGFKSQATQKEFELKVLRIVDRIRMTPPWLSRGMVQPQTRWARLFLWGLESDSLIDHITPRLTMYMPVSELLLYFRKRMISYVTHRWDPRFESEEENVRDLAYQWFNCYLRYWSPMHRIARYYSKAETISVQFQLRYQIVQLHHGTYCHQTDPLCHSLLKGELKENQRIIQRYWTGAAWCFRTLDLSVSSPEYQLILNIGWLFTWNHIPEWWEDLWQYVNSDDFNRDIVLELLRNNLPRISRISDYGSPSGCRDAEGLSDEVEMVIAQLYDRISRENGHYLETEGAPYDLQEDTRPF